MRGPLEGGIGRRPVAAFDGEPDVVRRLVPDRGRILFGRPAGRGHRRQDLVVDRDRLRRVLRLLQRFGHHERHRGADVAHPVAGEDGMQRAEFWRRRTERHRRDEVGDAVDAVGLDLRAGQHEQDAGRASRGFSVDRPDRGGGVRRAKDVAVRLARQDDVVDIAALALEKTGVLRARDRLPDTELHLSPPADFEAGAVSRRALAL